MELVVEPSMSTSAARPPTNGSTPVLAQAGADERAVLQRYLKELDEYYVVVKDFHSGEPAEVLQLVAGISGRLCEMRALLQRSGSTLAAKLRTREVEPLMDQLDLQFRIASRLLSVKDFEFRASGGGV